MRNCLAIGGGLLGLATSLKNPSRRSRRRSQFRSSGSLRRLTLALTLTVAVIPALANPVDYGLAKLAVAAGTAVAQLPVRVVSNDPTLGPDGFALAREGSRLLVSGGTDRGAMYGLLEVAEQLRLGTPLAQIQPKTARARFGFRTIKFNLPFAAYRTSPTIEQHHDVCRDLKFWEAFLDMMAANRFNTLTLWSQHPFHYFVVPKSFPEAQTFSSAEMAEWRTLWTRLFALAKERGIETYLINWNTFVSPEFARAHNLGEYHSTGAHIGDGTKDKIVEAYTRECVQQTIDEYPDLTGMGITLGERMGGQTPDERRQWLDDAFFAGIAAARRPVKFIYRAPLSADSRSGGTTSEDNDRRTRAQIEGLRGNANIAQPVFTEFKYNWSHGHSSPHLFIVHGGKLSDAYWNPPPTSHQVVWTIRNEDFYVLRWGAPDFIREFIANNGAPHVAGVLVGSECYIPAKDYITNEGRHKTWTWAFQRQWLWYALWGRLLYDPQTPDRAFEALLAERFGAAQGPDLLKAWTLASRAQLRFAAFHQGRADGTLYTEGFTAWSDNSQFRFFDIENIITHPVLDTKYVNVADFVAAGGVVPAGKVSPLQLAAELERDMAEAQRLATAVRRREQVSPTLEAELADIDAWCAHGRYFAAKLRGAVALASFRKTGEPARQSEAVAQLEKAAGHWRELSAATTRFNKPRLPHNAGELFSWLRFLPAVERDIDIARGTAQADTPARPAPVEAPVLKSAFKDHFLVGAALNRSHATGRSVGRRTLEQVKQEIALIQAQFNQITAENDMKWQHIHPREGTDGYDFGPADAFVEFGEKHGLHLVGHTLVWHNQTPDWVFAGTNPPPKSANPPPKTGPGGLGRVYPGPRASREELLGRMRDHIHAVVGRYRGKVKVWDVVNEALADGGPENVLRNSLWLEIIGPDYIAKAFQYAHEADPEAILRYNDYGLEDPVKLQKLVTLIKSLQEQKVPIHAIGTQAHLHVSTAGFEPMDRSLTELAKLGLPLHVTELDITCAQGGQRGTGADIAANATATQGGLVAEADQRLVRAYEGVFRAFVKHRDTVEMVTFWGVNDAVSWRREGNPLLFDGNNQPKAAFEAVMRIAARKPLVARDLTALHAAARVLVNPHKGWYHHFPDNHPDKYRIARDADLLDFPGMDHVYIRLAWAYLEPLEGRFDWAVIDRIIEKWTAKGLGIAFRISCKETSTDRIEQQYATPRWVKEAGAQGGYYRAGQAAGPEAPWEPLFDDPVFLEKLERFLAAFAARYDRQPWLRYVDIGSIGDWGEGHSWAGSRKTLSLAVRKLHVDLHLKHFKRAPLVISDDFVHALQDRAERESLHRHILANGISYRDDSIMVNGYFSGTSDSFTVRSPEYFADAYRLTPTVFELEHYGKVKQLGNWEVRPESAAAQFGRGKSGPDFFRGALQLLHATYIGYHGDAREWLDDNPALTRELLNRCGYWLFPLSLELPSTLGAGTVAPFRLTIDNRGVAPPYQPYELRVKLSGDRASWVGVVGRTGRSWLPGAPIVVQDQLVLPADLQSGRYAVSLGLFDASSGKDRPVEFALQASLREPEGYYRVAETEVTSAAQPKR